MTNPLHAAHYADRAVSFSGEISRTFSTRDTFRAMAAPEIARRIPSTCYAPPCGLQRPALGRPLALYDTVFDGHGQPWAIDVVYLVVGKLTSKLARLSPGATLDVWGPLGNGFSPRDTEHLLMVAGGIGQTPFLALAAEALGRKSYGDLSPPRPTGYAQRVSFLYGARNATYLAGLSDFEQTGAALRVSTDDGSAGRHGLVTELLREEISSAEPGSTRVVCCGPERMMEAVAEICLAARVPCEVSLETPMACGIGICFSCVAKVARQTAVGTISELASKGRFSRPRSWCGKEGIGNPNDEGSDKQTETF